MSPRLRLQISVCFCFLLATLPGSVAQRNKGKNSGISAATAEKDAKGVPPEPSKSSAAIASAASNALNQMPAPGADYIPCRFTDAQLKSLSAPEQVITLSPADAEELVARVTFTVQQQQQAGLISPDEERELFLEITKSKLTGLTPSQALQRIIEATLNARTSVVLLQGKVRASETKGAASQATGPTLGALLPANAISLLELDTGSAKEASDKAASQKSDAVRATTNAKSEITNKTLLPGTETSRNMAAIVDSARETIERLSRPTDVGCAMSVLSYNETDKAFGYIIANNYIAVQVVVRNLNRDQQFVVHDVEYSVNTDPTGTIGRYYSGRDKVVVRALASAEGSFDPRNMIVHTAQGIGAIMTTLVPIFGGAIGDAAAAYNGGFFPSLDKGWKDMSTDQLNLLNDTGFTSQSTSQTVVPKADKAMFVTFIPSKQFERGWWTMDCVKATPLGVLDSHRIRALEPLGANTKTGTTEAYTPVDEAIRACAIEAYTKLNKTKKSRPVGAFIAPEVTPEEIANDKAAAQQCQDLEHSDESKLTPDQKGTLLKCESPSILFANVPKRLFRKWNGNSVELFQELSSVVIAGMHIVDEATLQPGLTSIDCTKDGSGNVVFPFPDKGTLVCPLKGKNLAKVKALRLRNTDESAYTDGAVVASSGDDSTGTVTFTSSVLHALKKPEYTVAALNATNVETATNQVLHFDLNPYVSKTDPVEIDAKSLSSAPNMTLNGYHLDKVAAVHFYTTDAAKFVSFTPLADPAFSDLQIKIKFDAAALKQLGSVPADVKLSIAPTGNAKDILLSNTLKFTPDETQSSGTAPVANKPAPVKRPTK